MTLLYLQMSLQDRNTSNILQQCWTIKWERWLTVVNTIQACLKRLVRLRETCSLNNWKDKKQYYKKLKLPPYIDTKIIGHNDQDGTVGVLFSCFASLAAFINTVSKNKFSFSNSINNLLKIDRNPLQHCYVFSLPW